MKRIITLAITLTALAATAIAGGHNEPAEQEQAAVPATEQQIHWMTINEAEAAMKKEPRKVWIDFYTSWCGWCKVMDKKTYTNPNVISYMNEHFYAVRMDAEQKEPVSFQGKEYVYVPGQRVNQFAVEMMHGQLSYPTGVFMEDNFQHPIAIPGYHDVAGMEVLLKFMAEGFYKKVSLPVYQQTFKASWN